jgi:uncharacterized metal-binding protein YceD (DUF177 family)
MAGLFRLVVPLDRLGPAPSTFRVVASPDARAELAHRFDLLAMDRLKAELHVRRTASGADASGWFAADVVQACIISGEPVPATLSESVGIRFEPAPDALEIELDAASLDIFPVEAGAIDLGEAVAELLAAALDPWPRAADDALAAARARLLSEEEAAAERAATGPFAALRPPRG